MNKNSVQLNSQIIIYRDESGEVKLDVRFDGDTVWLTQKMMAELFDVSVANEEEVTRESTIKEFLIVQAENEYEKFHQQQLSQKENQDNDFEKMISLVVKKKASNQVKKQ